MGKPEALAGHRRFASGLVVLGLLLAGCHAPLRSWPFPPARAEDLPGAASILRERVSDIGSLYALLAFSFDVAGEGGVFEAAVRYRSPGTLRMTAFKDLLVQTRPVFDLVLAQGRYSLTLETPEGPRQSAGSDSELATDTSGFRAIALFREALFLPGLGAGGAPRIVADSKALEVQGTTPAGVPIVWRLDPATLGVEEARLLGTAAPVVARYWSYRAVGGRFLPEAFELRDEAARVRVEGSLVELELNPALEADAFEAPGLEGWTP